MGARTVKRSAGSGKNKNGGIPKKASLWVYVIVLVLAVAARTIQLKTNLDYQTGRYINDSVMLNYPMMIIVAGIIVMAFIMLAGTAKDKVIKSCILINPMRLRYDRVSKKIPHMAAYASAFSALLIIIEIIIDISTLVMANERLRSEMPEEEAEVYSLMTGYGIGDGVVHVLMAFTVIVFISMAVNIFKGEGLNYANCASLAIYAFWKVAEIVVMLNNEPVLSAKTHEVYILLSNMAAVAFFLTTARFFNGMEKKFTRFWMCMFGYTASILAAVSVFPRYIMLLMVSDLDFEDRVAMSVPAVSDISIVFMTIMIVAVFWSTYVYRVMPKLNIGNRRWSKAPMSKDYQKMETITVKEGETLPDRK